jgi:two-component system sensor histidine kinase YesM
MIERFRFHTKLIFAYSFIIITIILLISLLFSSYIKKQTLENAQNECMQNAVIMQNKVDSALIEMRNIIGRIQERKEIIAQFRSLQENSGEEGVNRLQDNLWIKRLLLNSIDINSETYRVSVFNDLGDFVSTGAHIFIGNELRDNVLNAPWYLPITEEKQEEYFQFPIGDGWAKDREIKVYSIIAPLKYFDEMVGFVEVQRHIEEFYQAEFDQNLSKQPTRMIIDKNGKLFYSNRASYGSFLTQHYMSADAFITEGAVHSINPVTQEDEMIVILPTRESWHVIVTQELKQIYSGINSYQATIVLTAVIVLVFSLFLNYVFTMRLTIPLKKLKKSIDTIQTGNLTKVEPEYINQKSNDELAQIQRSFVDMQTRLNESINNKVKLQYMQAKAHFDSLQSKINPHYLYNTLGVICAMCIDENQTEIASMCLRLSEILRYSMSSAESISTVREELTHAENYLILMKKRYEHRLEYSFHTDERILNMRIPKLIIQPLIENSIFHGYERNTVPIMKISIDAGLLNNQWEISIHDNGSGFTEESLTSLRSTIDEYKRQSKLAEKSGENISIDIGIVETFKEFEQHQESLNVSKETIKSGLGIINTYIRMDLFSQHKAIFSITNDVDGGALITIQCPIDL